MSSIIRTNLRLKLFSIILVALSAGLIVVGSFFYLNFKSFLVGQLEVTLSRHVALAELDLDLAAVTGKDLSKLKTFCDRASKASSCRVTIVDRGGNVLADSEIAMGRLNSVENHLNRPEIQQALQTGSGFNIRRSNTIGQDLLYSCRLLRIDDQPIGFLRLAFFADSANRLLASTRYYAIGGGLLIFLLSIILVTLLSRRINRNLADVMQGAKALADGKLETRIEVRTQDELGKLGRSLNELAERLATYLAKIQREQNDLNAVLASINEGIIAVAPDKRIVFLNQKSLQLLASTMAAAKGGFFYEVIRNQHLNSLIESFLRRPFLVSDEIQAGSRVLEVVISSFSFHTSNGADEKGAVVVLRDISQYKKLEKIRSDFVANVSHEFKTPLAAIRGYTESLIDWGLEDKETSRKYLNKIVRQSLQLESLVADLLQLARIERLEKIELITLDATPILHDLHEQYLESAREQGIELTLEINDALQHYQILGDPDMFRSIMANLIDNAIKYTPDGGCVSVSAQRDKKSMVFSVEDNGIGISNSEQARIFERFYRVDKARSRAISGTGLGLSIVKHLAELQYARLSLKSHVDQGSRFSIAFKISAQPQNSARPTSAL